MKKHFGDRLTMELKSGQKNVSAYYNLDNGGGKIRGIYMQSNDAVRPIFEAWLEPFKDLVRQLRAFATPDLQTIFLLMK